MTAVRHYHHHYRFSYITSFRRHFFSIVVILGLLSILLIALFRFIAPNASELSLNPFTPFDLLKASLYTMMRLTVAYLFALIISIPMALFITSSPKIERFTLPLFDIIQSVPVLAFFPLIVLIFIKLNFFEGAAIFVIFTAMIGTLVFSMIGGIKTIPEDIKNASIVFKARGIKELFSITLPSIVPFIITGSLLAWAAGWNIIIVAEVLHTYIPGGTRSQDLFGLGSLMVNSTYDNKTLVFICSLTIMVVLIGLINFFIWQKLLHLAQRYKFD